MNGTITSSQKLNDTLNKKDLGQLIELSMSILNKSKDESQSFNQQATENCPTKIIRENRQSQIIQTETATLPQLPTKASFLSLDIQETTDDEHERPIKDEPAIIFKPEPDTEEQMVLIRDLKASCLTAETQINSLEVIDRTTFETGKQTVVEKQTSKIDEKPLQLDLKEEVPGQQWQRDSFKIKEVIKNKRRKSTSLRLEEKQRSLQV